MLLGHHLTVDECMSAWNGSDGKYRHDGMPHKTKIPWKPQGVGAEMKSLCCGVTGIIMKLEGKDRQAAKPYYAEYGEGTAIITIHTALFWVLACCTCRQCLFLCENTGALKSHGLRFMGIVKTATKGFPKHLLTLWAAGELEDMKPNSIMVITFCLKQQLSVQGSIMHMDGPTRNLSSSYQTVAPQTQGSQAFTSPRRRHRREVVNGEPVTVSYEKHVKRPHMSELLFEHFNAIDVHDHLRQGSLAMEREWCTHSRWHRMFGTILGSA